jgi:hypothetical protein
MRHCLLVVACVACSICVVNANADLISYDSGTLGVGYSNWGLSFANLFTNDDSIPVQIDAILIRHLPQSGYSNSVNASFWANDGGIPGTSTNVGQYTLTSGWPRIDVSHLGLVLDPGESIFAGLNPVGNFRVNYDNQTSGSGVSWWLQDINSMWALGGPNNTHRNLMVRLEVTPSPQAATVPEPSSALLVVMGIVGLATRAGRRNLLRISPSR